MTPVTKKSRHAHQVLDDVFGGQPEWRTLVEEERVHAEVARQIHSLRRARGLTQTELAGTVGTTQSVIACLENADYRGHSLRMLRRIAGALDARVVVALVDREKASG